MESHTLEGVDHSHLANNSSAGNTDPAIAGLGTEWPLVYDLNAFIDARGERRTIPRSVASLPDGACEGAVP